MTTMAALRRLLSAASGSPHLRFASTRPGDRFAASSRGRVVAGICLAAGGALVYYCCGQMYEQRRRSRLVYGMTGRAVLPSLPAVVAKEKAGTIELDDTDVYMSSHEQRFRLFSSVEYEGQLYMTPQNFIESVTMSEPKNRKPWRSLTKQELEKILSETPPVWKGTSKLFRNLRERGIIAYTEYLFLLCILTKPHAGFKIAFNMFDADGNQMVDKREFLVLQEIFRKKNEKGRKGDAEKSAQLRADEGMMVDTTLLVHFFGKKGKAELTFDDFYRFMDNLQTEVLEIEFLTYSKGMTTISEEDFARILLRYTTVENISSYLENVRQSIPDEKGITFEEFRSFFQFLNNLEDFAIAMQMYNFASRSIGQDEFGRAVYVATGLKLSRHLVNTIFKIFDVDHDDQLSYKEFIGIMKDRLHRGTRVSGVSFFTCVHVQAGKHLRQLWRRFKEKA
ncbi:calcium uptake protein 3, mitochondrial isoform X6 [Paramormyrops kingsleyae]|uniref:calcium uptake protein 3, mitochondrial isoform X6 n=1 Tax=Paramormyrops kingsleyae TaxID=1676925 RepID=UPI000CD608B8|nr:calcium uptake protein 3, mitochondrial isoform X10 [Paramormyrops kingsleyae]